MLNKSWSGIKRCLKLRSAISKLQYQKSAGRLSDNDVSGGLRGCPFGVRADFLFEFRPRHVAGNDATAGTVCPLFPGRSKVLDVSETLNTIAGRLLAKRKMF